MHGLLTGRRRDPAFDEEIETHLSLLADRFVRQGMSVREARHAARRQFGNTVYLKEERSEMRTVPILDNLQQDLRHGARLLLRNPGFSAVAFLTLGLGIGVNTAVFSIVEGLLIRPLPYPEAERLVVPATTFQRYSTDRGPSSYADILDWKGQGGLFEAVSAYNSGTVDLTGDGEPERVRGLVADRDYARVMRIELQLGRWFTPAEDAPGGARVAVLGHGLWMRRFGGDPGVIGRRIEIGGAPAEIIGVTRKDSTWPTDAQLFRPMAVNVNANALRRDNHAYRAVARFAPGVTLERAQAALTTMGVRIAREDTNRGQTNWKLHPLAEFIVGPGLRQTLLVLLGAALFVLLMACVNVANLLLARGAARGREVAIRNALGAGWKRVAAQFLAEGGLIAAAGGLAGLAIGYAALKGLLRFAPPDIPRLDAVRVDTGVLAFTALLCLAAAVLAGLAPAIHTARQAPVDSLREGGRGLSDPRRGARLRGILVVSELALAIVLLTGAGLMIRSFSEMQRIDPGFGTEKLLTFQVSLPRTRYAGPPQIVAAFDQLTARIGQIPGVRSASATSALPVGGGGFYLGRVFLKEAQPEPPSSTDSPGAWSVIQPGYFETMGMRLVAGRSFTDRDTAESTPVVVISQSMATEMFPNQSPLGRRIRSWRDENRYREIVGVVGDVRHSGLTEDIGNNVYIPHRQNSWNSLVMVVRTDRSPESLINQIRGQVWSVDAKLSLAEVRTADAILDAAMARPRFSMLLLGIFGATALVLAAIGIYGVVAFNVAQRRREIGIRIALGAERGDVLRMVGKSALVLAGTGTLCGLAGALALTRWLRTLLFQISPTDPGTFAAVSALLVGVALAAACIPARRATRVDPVVTLRDE